MRMGKPSESLGYDEMVTADWETTDDWGIKDTPIVKSEFIEPENLEEDIARQADHYFETGDLPTIHGNINILADDIVKAAMIVEGEESDYFVIMNINTDVANADEPSVKMLSKENGTKGDCNWLGVYDPNESGMTEDTGMNILFRIWDNGLFRLYCIRERWIGKIDAAGIGISGIADSSLEVHYSYTDRDCDMTPYLETLEKAKASKKE